MSFGPTAVPSTKGADTRRSKRSAAGPRSRTRSPRMGSAMPRLPQKCPPSDHGDSQPRPSTAWYSMSSRVTGCRGAMANPSIQRCEPRSPIHSSSRVSTSPRPCTCAATSASAAVTPAAGSSARAAATGAAGTGVAATGTSGTVAATGATAGAAAGAMAAAGSAPPLSRITCSRGASCLPSVSWYTVTRTCAGPRVTRISAALSSPPSQPSSRNVLIDSAPAACPAGSGGSDSRTPGSPVAPLGGADPGA